MSVKYGMNTIELGCKKYCYVNQDKFCVKEVCGLFRLQLRRFIRIITGHNTLRYFNHVPDNSLSPVCRLCSYADETFCHLATECVGTRRLRREFFGDRDIFQNLDWDMHEILEFSYAD